MLFFQSAKAASLTAVFSILLLMLSGCTSTWRAPVYSYPGPQPERAPQYQNTSPINSRYYKVRKGDTLYSIAWRTGRDYKNLAQWNRLEPPYTIYIGQMLITQPPKKTAVSTTRKPVKKATTQKTPKTKPVTQAKPSAKEKFKKHLSWRWPTRGRIIKGFKKGDDTRKGVVLSGKVNQSILSAEEGKVVYSGSGLIGYGQLIIIKHNNNYLSAYGHNRRILVKEGDWVTKGKKIAQMGLNDSGVPVLHFEIRKNGNPINPVAVLPRRN